MGNPPNDDLREMDLRGDETKVEVAMGEPGIRWGSEEGWGGERGGQMGE
jgi:hypothetical protein